jgi:hypothetical protein
MAATPSNTPFVSTYTDHRDDVLFGSMMPSSNNLSIDIWIDQLERSGKLPVDRVERVRELACEAIVQWKRKALVQRMLDSIKRERRRSVPIQDIFEIYEVHFTIETMNILESGIQQSLRNFCRMLADVLSAWDADFSHRPDHSVLASRATLATNHAPSCLWSSLDSADMCQNTVHSRLLKAVEGLWNTHAKPAIASEHRFLAEGIQRLRVLIYVCDEYLKPSTGGKAVPSKFSAMYIRMHQRVIAALAWLSGNSTFVSNSKVINIVRLMLNAYKLSEFDARGAMDEHAAYVREMVRVVIQVLENLYQQPYDWDGWHGVLLWGGDEDPPEEAESSLVVQPPSYSARFWTTTRVYCSVAMQTGTFLPVRFQPVVRFCAMLRLLVRKHFLRLDLIGVDYLRLISLTDHSRYHRNVNRIVDDEFVHDGHAAGHPFDAAWFLESRAPVLYTGPGPRLSDIALVLADDEAERAAASNASDTGLTDDCERVMSLSKQNPLPAPVPEGVVLDHCLLGLIALIAKNNILGNHMGPFCNTFHIGIADVEPWVRSTLSMELSLVSAESLSGRLTGIFKMLCTAMVASGMQASFGVDKSHPRVKKLKFSWVMEEQHRANNLTRLAELATTISEHLHHGTPLPYGVEWNIPERSRRRRKARDAKSVSDVLLSRCVS